MLARYRNYVAEETDFPLTEFTTRNSAASQAVGYGKTLMLWHMLRVELGDDLFLEGLRRLYADYRFQRIGFTGIAELFSEVAGFDLGPFFAQWVNRTGAPDITVSVDEVGNNQAQILFAQIQSGDPYELNVPLALYYAGREEPEIHLVRLTQKLEGVVAPDYDRLGSRTRRSPGSIYSASSTGKKPRRRWAKCSAPGRSPFCCRARIAKSGGAWRKPLPRASTRAS